MGPSELRIGSDLDEFPGRSFNLLVREWYRQRALLLSGTKSAGGPGHFLIVKARNITGELLQYGDCVALEGLAINFDDKADQQYGRPLLKAQIPTSALHHAVMGVALTNVEDGQPGPFIVMGGAWLKCDVIDDSHHFVKLEENQPMFSPLAISATSGYPIIDRQEADESGNGFVWVFALLGIGTSSSGGGGDVVLALIDEDIDPGAIDDDPPVEQENSDPLGEPLPLWAFEPRSIDLKYYRVAQGDESQSDPGWEEGKLKYILVTVEVEVESDAFETQYDTKTFYYLDGKPFKLGDYTRADYPDYEENAQFPPEGLPAGFLKKRYRAQAKPDADGRLWLDFATCKELPPPELPEET